MTIDNWLTLANTIATLIATITALLLFIMSRVSQQPKPKPEVSQPKHKTTSIRVWLLHLFQSPWKLPPFLILANICMLLYEVRKTGPVTHQDVYQISVAVGAIVLNISNVSELSVWKEIRRLKQQDESNKALLGLLNSLFDLIKTVNVIAESTAQTLPAQIKTLTPTHPPEGNPNKTRRGILGKLAAVLKIIAER